MRMTARRACSTAARLVVRRRAGLGEACIVDVDVGARPGVPNRWV